MTNPAVEDLALTEAVDRFADHHPTAVCGDCLTLVYQAGILAASEVVRELETRLATIEALADAWECEPPKSMASFPQFGAALRRALAVQP